MSLGFAFLRTTAPDGLGLNKKKHFKSLLHHLVRVDDIIIIIIGAATSGGGEGGQARPGRERKTFFQF